jgi:hypothetical protein
LDININGLIILTILGHQGSKICYRVSYY